MKSILSLLWVMIAVFQLTAQSKVPAQEVQDSIPQVALMDDSLMIQMQQQQMQLAAQMAKATVTYFILRVPDEKYGYTVFIDGQMYIEQKTIPAVAGNMGFSTKEEAERVVQLVIAKIKQGEMPPTISVDELDQLKIAY